MDNLISGVFAVSIFTAFVGGLAHSIGALPFAIIVAAVVIAVLVDFVQSAKASLAEEAAAGGQPANSVPPALPEKQRDDGHGAGDAG